MAALPIIEKLGRIKDLGMFRDCSASEQPRFRRYNLIYGFNGSGKTTLSRLFASLGAGSRAATLPEEGTFEVHLTDGSLQACPDRLGALSGRILVFNADFIEDSFYWKQGEARPVFYIGKEQAELAQELALATEKAVALQSKLEVASVAASSAERAFTLHKRTVARNISEQTGLGRKYDASNLMRDYSSSPSSGYSELGEAELIKSREILSQAAPMPKLPSIELSPEDMRQLVLRGCHLLKASPAEIVLADLREHGGMRQWVGEGLRYHDDHELSSCLFCGNRLSNERKRSLHEVIDDAFEALIMDLKRSKIEVVECSGRLRAIELALPRISDLAPDLRNEMDEVTASLRAAVARGSDLMTSLLALIETKLASPHRQPDELELPTAAEVLEGISAAIASINRIVQRHNGLMDSFQEEQHRALTAIKGHLLGRAQAVFDELKATAEDASKKLSEANEGREALTRRRESLQSAMRSHGPAAEVITRLIHNYLGRRDLELVAAEDGYRLRRNGKLVRGSLSEGEKTAIAICYFIITLEAEGRKRKDLIVIVDDPVSSLDTRALNYSFSILRAVVAEAGQVFILTHNLHFMNEVRKWLGSKTEHGLKRDGKDPSKVAAALLFLDTVQPGGPETRACRLRELPKHIRDYESEYHYLVHLILRFASDPDEVEYFFLLPNALRKVMDVFLAFRMPGPDGLGSKVNKLARELEGSGIDPARIQALERLAQMESHADNLDDLVTFSTATVEEVRAAAETLIELISTLDPRHWQTMKSLCG